MKRVIALAVVVALAGGGAWYWKSKRSKKLGDKEQTVATKIASVSDALGGIDRVTLQMTNERLAHRDMLRSIELLGTEVMPRVAGSLAG